MSSVREVNAELKRLGYSERLRQGRGYCYFYGGNCAMWQSSSVYVSRVQNWSVDQWVRELKEMKESNDDN